MPEGQIPFPMSDVMINYRHKKALASFKKDVRQALENRIKYKKQNIFFKLAINRLFLISI